MKEYVKPDVYYEDFELSSHIATCTFDMVDSQKPQNCSATNESFGSGYSIFVIADICVETIPESEVIDYCYTDGAEGNNIFNS